MSDKIVHCALCGQTTNPTLEEQLIEAEALLFRSQLLLDGQDCSEKLFVEINDYYKQYILPTHKK